MFSAVISTAAIQLDRVKETGAKEKQQKRRIPVGFRPVLGSSPRDYFAFLYG